MFSMIRLCGVLLRMIGFEGRIVVVWVGRGRLVVGVSDMNSVLLKFEFIALLLVNGIGVRVTGGRLMTEMLVTRLLIGGSTGVPTFLIISGVEKSDVMSLNKADST